MRLFQGNKNELVNAAKSIVGDLQQFRDQLKDASANMVLGTLLEESEKSEVAQAGLENFMLDGSEEQQTEREFLAPEKSSGTGKTLSKAEILTFGQAALDKIARTNDPESLSDEEAEGLEAIIMVVGRPALLIQNDDFGDVPQDFAYLNEHRAEIRLASQSVGRIEVTGHPRLSWVGTAFVVGPQLLMTNRHVAKEFCFADSKGKWHIEPDMTARIDFHEEFGNNNPFEFDIEDVLVVHEKYDLSLMRVKATSRDAQPAPHPLTLTSQPLQRFDGAVYVIGYPAVDLRNGTEAMRGIFRDIYDVKRLQPGNLTGHEPARCRVFHDCSTLGGNSGSPVFDPQTSTVIGLHFGGEFLGRNRAIELGSLRDDTQLAPFALNWGTITMPVATEAGTESREGNISGGDESLFSDAEQQTIQAALAILDSRSLCCETESVEADEATEGVDEVVSSTENAQTLELVELEEAPGLPLVIFGGKPVHRDLGAKLNLVIAGLTPAEGQRLKASMAQGFAPPSSFSGSTHTQGMAADFLTGTWSDNLIRKIVNLLQANECAAVLRIKGEIIPGATPISVEHIHTALRPHSNSLPIDAVTKPGAHRFIEREIVKRPHH